MPSDEGPDSVDDVAGPSAVLDDLAERLPDFLEIRRAGAQPAQGGVSVGDRSCDGLVDLVCDRGRQLAHGRYAIDMRQLRLRLAQGLLCLLALSNVPPDAAVAGEAPVSSKTGSPETDT